MDVLIGGKCGHKCLLTGEFTHITYVVIVFWRVPKTNRRLRERKLLDA